MLTSSLIQGSDYGIESKLYLHDPDLCMKRKKGEDSLAKVVSSN